MKKKEIYGTQAVPTPNINVAGSVNALTEQVNDLKAATIVAWLLTANFAVPLTAGTSVRFSLLVSGLSFLPYSLLPHCAFIRQRSAGKEVRNDCRSK